MPTNSWSCPASSLSLSHMSEWRWGGLKRVYLGIFGISWLANPFTLIKICMSEQLKWNGLSQSWELWTQIEAAKRESGLSEELQARVWTKDSEETSSHYPEMPIRGPVEPCERVEGLTIPLLSVKWELTSAFCCGSPNHFIGSWPQRLKNTNAGAARSHFPFTKDLNLHYVRDPHLRFIKGIHRLAKCFQL